MIKNRKISHIKLQKLSSADFILKSERTGSALKNECKLGIRDYSDVEWNYIEEHSDRITVFLDKDIKERQYNGDSWKQVVDDIIETLPQNVYISFDIDGLDPKLCPLTGTPVHGGFEAEQVFFLLRKIKQSGRKFIGFDLSEIGISNNEWDENVGARVLFKLCHFIVSSNS